MVYNLTAKKQAKKCEFLANLHEFFRINVCRHEEHLRKFSLQKTCTKKLSRCHFNDVYNMGGRSQGQRLADCSDCFQLGPAPNGSRAMSIDLRKLMRNPQFLGAHSFFGALHPHGACCQWKSKWTARYFNILIHHNSFWNRNSGHWFSMCGLVFSTAARSGRGFIEAVFCFSWRYFVLRRLLLFQQLLPLVFWK